MNKEGDVFSKMKTHLSNNKWGGSLDNGKACELDQKVLDARLLEVNAYLGTVVAAFDAHYGAYAKAFVGDARAYGELRKLLGNVL